MRTIELLCPAKNADIGIEAIRHGADAVYIGGPSFGARAAAGNSIEDIQRLCDYAHVFGARVYVTLNVILYDDELEEVEKMVHALYAAGVDALITQDLALLKMNLPPIALHASTQMDTITADKAQFLEQCGYSQIVVGRELSIDQLKAITEAVKVPIEAFVHGAMCISYSGRCTLSNHMSMRDANRGGCSQSCRWKYDLYDMPFGKERKSLKGEIPEEFSMSAVDMSMIDHIPDMIENGVDSLKIEGRMKSIHYVSTVTNCYKAAVDAYLESPEKFEAIKQDLIDEMWKVAQRELATGFYYGTPSENEQLFGARRKIPEYKFVAEVVSYDDATQTATIRQRNVINEGDQVEFYGPGFRHFETYIEDLHDAKGNKIDRAPNPMELLTIKVPQPVQAGDMVRALKEGLINLYKEDGTSVTVRA